MPTATKPFHNRIALIFDFDETLAPSTYHFLLAQLGLDADKFFEERIDPLVEAGWETILARGYCLIEESKTRHEPITQATFEQVGQVLELFDGVQNMFDRVRRAARDVVSDVEVEFYLLTAGFIEIPRATSIAEEFDELWGGEFHFNDREEIAFVKKIITHPEKERYILQLAKGLSGEGPNSPSDVYRDVPEEEWRVPLNQIIYVGDGASDMPAFSLMNERGGMAIGVFKADTAEEWEGYDDTSTRRRVQNLAPADYSEGSELMQSLILAVESICKRIALRRLSIGE